MQYSKWELVRCPHGKMRWARWMWEDHLTIEDSEIDFGPNGCKLCRDEVK